MRADRDGSQVCGTVRAAFRAGVVIAAMVLAPAMGQGSRPGQPATQPAAPPAGQPGTAPPAAPAPTPAPVPGAGTPAVIADPVTPRAAPPRPALQRDPQNKRDWTLKIEVHANSVQVRAREAQNIQPRGYIESEQITFVYPLIEGSGSSETWLDKITSSVKIDGRVLTDTPRILRGYQAETVLGAWDVTGIRTRRISLFIDTAMTSYETRIDEAAARRYTWPKNDWPADIKLCLEPQALVQSDDPRIIELANRLTEGNVRGAPPYLAAKYLAGKVLEMVQPTGQDHEFTGAGFQTYQTTGVYMSGFRVGGALQALETGRGSIHDLPCLLTAVYRAAGIPARLVIGLDVEDHLEAERKGNPPAVRSWVEFYLFDEANNTGEWIPVDITRQREFSSKAPPLDQRWQFFGHNERSDFMCPFAFHWLPPTVVTTPGPPAVWGWLPKGDVPAAVGDLRFQVMETPKRAEDMKRKPRG